MAGKRDLRDKVASMFELPADVMMDVPRISLVGDMELVVENHRGLSEYKSDRVVLAVSGGQVAISGADLAIGSVSPDQIVILGKIRAFQYID
ncbi:MAG TPA: sporulation protein YqfC [Symbiobacteriaceae bacterium]